MSPTERRVYGAVAAFYLLLFLLLVWPIYPRFAGARPFVLGMPLSLVYVVALVVLSFLGLLGLFLWEGRRRSGESDPEPNRGRDGDSPGSGTAAESGG